MNFELVVSLVRGFLDVAPTITTLATDIVGPLISNVRAVIDDLAGNGHITDNQAAELHAQADAAEAAWAVEVARAKAELI